MTIMVGIEIAQHKIVNCRVGGGLFEQMEKVGGLPASSTGVARQQEMSHSF